MDVYIDVLILENTIINFLILYVTSKFAKTKAPSWRLLLGSLIGTTYVIILLLMPSVTFYYTAVAKFILSMAIIAVSFWTSKIRAFLKVLVCFYISTFVFAGGAFAIIYLTGSGGFVRNGVYYIFRKNNGIVMILMVLFIGILVRVFYEIIQNRSIKGKMFVSFSIFLNNKSLSLRGLVDTGNSLHDPLSNLPVVIVEMDSIKTMLPQSLLSVLGATGDTDLKKLGALSECDLGARVRLVPFTSLGKENGLLVGFKPDGIYIGEDKKEVIAIVCIYNRRLSVNNSYSALLSPELV
jgi:stage II sporulation protein GA (sporulation sigma-E factor processing peptidase)